MNPYLDRNTLATFLYQHRSPADSICLQVGNTKVYVNYVILKAHSSYFRSQLEGKATTVFNLDCCSEENLSVLVDLLYQQPIDVKSWFAELEPSRRIESLKRVTDLILTLDFLGITLANPNPIDFLFGMAVKQTRISKGVSLTIVQQLCRLPHLTDILIGSNQLVSLGGVNISWILSTVISNTKDNDELVALRTMLRQAPTMITIPVFLDNGLLSPMNGSLFPINLFPLHPNRSATHIVWQNATETKSESAVAQTVPLLEMLINACFEMPALLLAGDDPTLQKHWNHAAPYGIDRRALELESRVSDETKAKFLNLGATDSDHHCSSQD